MKFHMAADHAIRPAEDDVIFSIAARAGEAAKIYGPSNIINSTIGALLDDEGKLVAFESVYNALKNLDNHVIAAYASLEGDPEFLKAAEKACFSDCRPDGYVRAVATPGGSGAVRHAVHNFTNPGDTFLTANWYWAPYKTIGDECGRKLGTFNLFNEAGEFDFASYKDAFERCLDKQKRLLVILNTPAHNPTGYTVSDEEWDKILSLAKKHAENEENKIIILCDIAYIDFAGENSRSFMKKFGNLPENILILIAYSASKSYTMYGLRNGAILCVTPSEEIAEEFYYSCAHSNRGIWSNGTMCAMRVFSQLYTDKQLYDACEKERDTYRAILKARGDAFMESAHETKLETTNYRGGFFVSVPCEDPAALCERLIKDKLFTVPLHNGIRIAICAISREKCRLAPKLIKRAMNELFGG